MTRLSRVRIPVGASDLSLPQNVQAGSGAHQVYRAALSSSIKRKRLEADPLPPSTFAISEWSNTPSTIVCLHGVSSFNSQSEILLNSLKRYVTQKLHTRTQIDSVKFRFLFKAVDHLDTLRTVSSYIHSEVCRNKNPPA